MTYSHRYPILLMILAFQLIDVSYQSVAASQNIDSLQQIISASNEDTRTADALMALAAFQIRSGNYDSAGVYAENALALSTRIHYNEGAAESHYIMSLVLEHRGSLQESETANKIYIDFARQISDVSKLGKGYYQMGILMSRQGKTDSAIYFLQESMKLNLILKDTLRLMAMSNLMGNIFQDLSEFDSAVFYYLKAVKLAEISGMQKFLGTFYNNVGKVFIKLEDNENARKYFTLALNINQLSGNEDGMALNYTNLGLCFAAIDQTDSAIAEYDKAREILNRSDDYIQKADLFNNYAVIYERKGNDDSALIYYGKALEMHKESGYAEGIMVALSNLGAAYSNSGNYVRAQECLDSSLAMSAETGHRRTRRNILSKMADNYYNSGDYKKAYEYQELTTDLNDSLFNLDKTRIINELKQKYEKEQDQARILTLEKESLQKTIQRNLVISAGLFILVLAVFGYIYFRQRIIKAKILAQQKLRQFEEEKRMMSARLLVEGQEEERKRIAMELHDGLGVLLSATKMQFTAVKDSSPENLPLFDKATHLLEQASQEARRISHNMMPGLLTKLGFFEAVDDMFENINEMDSIEAVCEIEGEQVRLPEKQEIMLYRIIQELTNNTLKYARASKIELNLTITPSMLVMSYKDDGIGFDMKKVLSSSTTSLGLRSIELRIGFLNGEMKIDSSPGNGMACMIRVPVEESSVVSRQSSVVSRQSSVISLQSTIEQ